MLSVFVKGILAAPCSFFFLPQIFLIPNVSFREVIRNRLLA